MIDEIYELYKRNLTYIERSEKTVKEILGDSENNIFIVRNGDNITGVSVINGNVIYLLCVDKPFRNKGVGSSLLTKSESIIVSKNYDKIVLGTGKEYIMPGAPMNEGFHTFFSKRGYIHSYGESGCFDMEQQLSNFSYEMYTIGDTIDRTTYRLATSEDIERVISCISDAEPKFLHYYRNREFYHEGTERPILIAE